MHNDLIIKNKEVSRIFRKSQEGEVIFFTLLSFFSPFLLLILVGGGGGLVKNGGSPDENAPLIIKLVDWR